MLKSDNARLREALIEIKQNASEIATEKEEGHDVEVDPEWVVNRCLFGLLGGDGAAPTKFALYDGVDNE